jgi:hypothetical protein
MTQPIYETTARRQIFQIRAIFFDVVALPGLHWGAHAPLFISSVRIREIRVLKNGTRWNLSLPEGTLFFQAADKVGGVIAGVDDFGAGTEAGE